MRTVKPSRGDLVLAAVFVAWAVLCMVRHGWLTAMLDAFIALLLVRCWLSDHLTADYQRLAEIYRGKR